VRQPALAISAPPQVFLPISGRDDLFPVRRVYCIGRNYAAHAVEMGHDPDREDPFFFQKNPDNLNTSGTFPYPAQSSDVHHEVEMAVALRHGGKNIPVAEALDHVFGYCVALDMTRRDLQGVQKKLGRPWEIGKAFEASAPISALMAASEIGHPDQGRINLHVNETLRQNGNLDQMIWKTPEIIAYLSEYFTLAAGDVILTGTPAGVAAVQRGDRMVAEIEGVDQLSVVVT